MKDIISLLVLICSVAVIIVSCAKKSDTSSTSTDTSASGSSTTDNTTIGTGTGTTASGTVTGDDNLTGIFNSSYWGQEPSGGCIDNSTALASAAVATGTVAFKKQFIVTSSTKFTISMQWYSDATCSTLIGYFNLGYSGVEFDSSVAMSLTAGSSPTKPTSAVKMKYVLEGTGIMGNTDGTLAYFTALGLTLESGVEKIIEESSITTYYTLINSGTQSGSDSAYLFIANQSTSSYPSDWSINDTVYWK